MQACGEATACGEGAHEVVLVCTVRSGRKNNRGEAAVLEIEGAGQEVYMKLPWRKPSQLRRPEGLVQTYR